jgi:hypothetical protein
VCHALLSQLSGAWYDSNGGDLPSVEGGVIRVIRVCILYGDKKGARVDIVTSREAG